MSLDTARRVLRIEAQAIQDVLRRLDATFEKAVDVLFQCKGRVVVTGMGKSGLIGRKISATLSSTGTPSFFLHPAEALHGDLGMLARGPVVVIAYLGLLVLAIILLSAAALVLYYHVFRPDLQHLRAHFSAQSAAELILGGIYFFCPNCSSNHRHFWGGLSIPGGF